VTWNRTGLVYDEIDQIRGYKLAIKPGESNVLFAVMTDGVWRTENYGVDWTMVQR
jgi:hypothetical protein